MAALQSDNFDMSHYTPAMTPDLTTPDVGLSRQGSDIELEASSRWGENVEHEHESSLPPVDGGKDAWMFLGAAFFVEVMVWGLPWSYGIFQEYYSTHPPLAGSANIAVIGTCAMGVLYMTAPLTFGILVCFPWLRRPVMIAGMVTMCLSVGLSALCSTVPQLIVTQEIIYGIGGAATYSPVIQYMDEWFVAKKGLAFGIMWTGTGIGGVVIPLLLQDLLSRYGHRATLVAWSLTAALFTLPLIPFMKPRLPTPAASSQTSVRLNFSFLQDRTFLIFQLGNVLESVGFFVPALYLPTYASQSLGASSSLAASTIVLLNVATVFGYLAMGAIIDKWNVEIGISISTIGTVLSVFLVWGFSTTLPSLLAFTMMYGFFAGSFPNTWPGIMRKVQQSTGQMQSSMMVFAFMCLGRGLGNVESGPVSEALFRMGDVGEKGLYGTRFGSLVVFTGVSAALGGVGALGKSLGWLRSV